MAAKIAQINNDLNSLKAKNMTEIQTLEGEREQNEKIIIKFKNDLSQADHDFATLQIMIEKTQKEIETLESQKDKHQS